MRSKSNDNRNRGLRGRKNHVPRFLCSVLVACFSALAVFTLAACSSSDGDNSSPHVDNGKLHIYYSTFLVSGEEEDHGFRSLSMFSEVDDGNVSSQDVKNAIDNFTLPRPEMTDPGFRLVDDIDKGNGESILIYAAYENVDKNKAAEMRVASYFLNDRLRG